MPTKKQLVDQLNDGKYYAQTGTTIETALKMPIGNTNEPTRGLIADCIINDNYPIGSCNRGYFLIDSQEELDEVVASLQSRIDGIKNRIAALKNGWKKRELSRKKGDNWPK